MDLKCAKLDVITPLPWRGWEAAGDDGAGWGRLTLLSIRMRLEQRGPAFTLQSLKPSPPSPPSCSAVEEVPGAGMEGPARESPPAASISDQLWPNGEGSLTLKFKEITQNQRLMKGKWVASSNL